MALFDSREHVETPNQTGLSYSVYRIALDHKAEVTIRHTAWGWEALLWDEDGQVIESNKDLFTVPSVMSFIRKCDAIVKAAYEPELPIEWSVAS